MALWRPFRRCSQFRSQKPYVRLRTREVPRIEPPPAASAAGLPGSAPPAPLPGSAPRGPDTARRPAGRRRSAMRSALRPAAKTKKRKRPQRQSSPHPRAPAGSRWVCGAGAGAGGSRGRATVLCCMCIGRHRVAGSRARRASRGRVRVPRGSRAAAGERGYLDGLCVIVQFRLFTRLRTYNVPVSIEARPGTHSDIASTECT